MPFYQRLGDVPRKRHIQFRDNGTLLTEEVMGLEGFTGNESILYHLQSPCRVQEIGAFEPIVRDEWVPETHQHLLGQEGAVVAKLDVPLARNVAEALVEGHGRRIAPEPIVSHSST